jgi:hypothetical protein
MRRRGIIHNGFVGLLVLLASLSFVATVVGAWTHQTALVSDRFVRVVASATSDPQVIDSMSTRLADQVVDRLGLEQRIQNVLPDALDRLAVPITQAVHDRIATAAANLLNNPQFQDRLAIVLARLHTGFLNIVNGDSQYFTTTNGKLTLDLLSVMDAVITELQSDGVLPTAADFPRFSAIADRTNYLAQLSTYVQAQLPPDFGQIPIADESSVDAIAGGLHLFDQALVGMGVLTVILALAALLFADRRWNLIAWLSFTNVFLIGLAILGLIGLQEYADNAVANPDNRVLLAALVRSLAQSLAAWLLVIGVALLFVAIPTAFLARRQRRSAEAHLVAEAQRAAPPA